MTNHIRIAALVFLSSMTAASCTPRASMPAGMATHISPISAGWARSSVNAVIFRQNSLVTHDNVQFAAYYDSEGRMVLAKRRLGTDAWQVQPTAYQGNVRDAHNAISIGVDGTGILHVAWDHHGQALNYARGNAPGSLDLNPPEAQTGDMESQVTYPGFYGLPDGDLLFLYRDGASGNGDVLLNRYDVESQRWTAVRHPLISGEGERNAYLNRLVVDDRGGWHLSWTWRESPDVASNHDIVYAFSPDEGRTWQASTGEVYSLPITAAQGEIAWRVPQGSELINQTSMTVDEAGQPVIATYWRAEGEDVPQFRIVWRDGQQWRMNQIGRRTTPFRLSGGGTKRIPVSRPQVVGGRAGELHMIFRDEERGGGISVATSRSPERDDWTTVEILQEPVGLWEPSYDPVVWRRDGSLHLFHQVVGQGDGETLEDIPPQMVSVLEWTP